MQVAFPSVKFEEGIILAMPQPYPTKKNFRKRNPALSCCSFSESTDQITSRTSKMKSCKSQEEGICIYIATVYLDKPLFLRGFELLQSPAQEINIRRHRATEAKGITEGGGDFDYCAAEGQGQQVPRGSYVEVDGNAEFPDRCYSSTAHLNALRYMFQQQINGLDSEFRHR